MIYLRHHCHPPFICSFISGINLTDKGNYFFSDIPPIATSLTNFISNGLPVSDSSGSCRTAPLVKIQDIKSSRSDNGTRYADQSRRRLLNVGFHVGKDTHHTEFHNPQCENSKRERKQRSRHFGILILEGAKIHKRHLSARCAPMQFRALRHYFLAVRRESANFALLVGNHIILFIFSFGEL